MQKILIVEDDNKLGNELKKFLENSGYEAKLLDSFSDTVNSILSFKADLVLLDINIPYLNGEIVCKEIRKTSSLPIIMVTSKNNDIDQLLSFNYGADDFVTKPFNTQILLARIERILKKNNNILNYENISLDMTKLVVKYDDKILDLSKNEFNILYYLVKNRGKIITREELIDYLWDSDSFVDDNTLTVNINRVRSKLDSIGYKDTIITKRGQGYIIL